MANWLTKTINKGNDLIQKEIEKEEKEKYGQAASDEWTNSDEYKTATAGDMPSSGYLADAMKYASGYEDEFWKWLNNKGVGYDLFDPQHYGSGIRSDKLSEYYREFQDWNKEGKANYLDKLKEVNQGLTSASGADNLATTSLSQSYPIAEKLGEINTAKQDAAQEAQAQAQQNALSNASAGINRSRAGLLASNNANSQSNVANNYQANRQLGTSTQNDYLQKMAQANALETQANNMQKGTGWNIASGALQGMGSGASVGATMGLSDERAKEAPIDEKLLREQIRQFKSLYRQLQQLKEDK